LTSEPLVSIVTPSFQARQFIKQTIDSVLQQDYPRIEYVVMDGGSTDGTVEILETYRDRLQYTSEPDAGAAAAINRGFQRSHGSIFAWLNADDVYLPGAITAAVRRLAESPEEVIYGEGLWIDQEGREIARYPTVSPYNPVALERECIICQPAAFMTREAFAETGMLDSSLHYAFDYDLWIRLSRLRQFKAVPDLIAASRMHRENKSLGSRRRVFEENIQLLRRHYGYVPVNWVYGYLAYCRDGRDQFFEPMRHSALTYLASLPAGLRYNHRMPWRYFKEWTSRLNVAAFQGLRAPASAAK
jgi:glycosyltransferase involved in cell wall biosynthesis